MKRLFIVIAVLLVPILMVLTASQGAKYYSIKMEIEALEEAQVECVEENRKLLTDIAIAGARAKVDEYFCDNADYRMVNPENTMRIQVKPVVEKLDG